MPRPKPQLLRDSTKRFIFSLNSGQPDSLKSTFRLIAALIDSEASVVKLDGGHPRPTLLDPFACDIEHQLDTELSSEKIVARC